MKIELAYEALFYIGFAGGCVVSAFIAFAVPFVITSYTVLKKSGREKKLNEQME